MNKIKRYRKKNKLTAREMARRVEDQGKKCDISYVYHLENGRSRPSYPMAKALYAAMCGEISIIDILENKN